MDKRVRLQIRILIFCVKLIDGIHLKEENKKALDAIVEELKNCTN